MKFCPHNAPCGECPHRGTSLATPACYREGGPEVPRRRPTRSFQRERAEALAAQPCVTETANPQTPHVPASSVGKILRPAQFYRAPDAGAPIEQLTRGEQEQGYEFQYETFPDSLRANGTIFPVLSTRRRWRGLDVYVNPPVTYFASAGAYLRCLIYGLNERTGLRSLVASGLIGGETWATMTQNGSNAVRIAYACGPLAQTFQVFMGLANGTQTTDDPWTVSAVATDESEMDLEVGTALVGTTAIPSVLGVAALLPGSLALPTWGLRVARGVVTNTAGAAGYLQFHDQATTAACQGVAPLYSIGLAAGATTTFGPEERPYRFQRLGLVAYPSTTAATGSNPAATDLVYSVVLQ